MDNLARDWTELSFSPQKGAVRGESEGLLLVEFAGGAVRARRAAGCLLKPIEGDVVLWWGSGQDDAYVLTVLERPGQGPAELETEGDLILRSRGGGVSLSGPGQVEMASSQGISLTAPSLEMDSLEMQVTTQKLGFWGRLVQARAGAFKLAARSLDAVIDRVHQKLRDCIRRVEGVDMVKAGQISLEADQLYSLRCGYGAVSADQDVKIDAEHIHLG